MSNSVNSGPPPQVVYSTNEVFAQTMGAEDILVKKIGKDLSLPDFAALALVCKASKTIIQPNIENKLLEKWLSIPGVWSISEPSALTEAQKNWVIAKLKGTCVFFNEPDSIQPHRFQNDKIKKMWQTHNLIFFPDTINGVPRTINTQNRLFHFIKEKDDGSTFDYIVDNEKEDAFRNQPALKSFWGLVPLDVAPHSRATSYETKESLLKNKGYEVLTPNDATTSNLIMNLEVSKNGKGYYFGREGKYWTFIATTELYYRERLIIGAAAASGPLVSYDVGGSGNVGAAGVAEVP